MKFYLIFILWLLSLPHTATASVNRSELKQSLTQYQRQVDQAFRSHCPSKQQTEQLLKQLALLNFNVDPNKNAAEFCPTKSFDNKIVLGLLEVVQLNEMMVSAQAMIDTAKKLSFLDARDIEIYKKKGQNWVRFGLKTKGEAQPTQLFERPILRFTQVQQSVSGSLVRRPVIKTKVTIGPHQKNTEVVLNSRQQGDYPFWVGRDFIEDAAIVDISSTFLQSSEQAEHHLSKNE
jgi:hypothetical protein